MLLAELEVCHSRPIAPTRRVALGTTLLPCDPAPGFGGLLLAGVVAQFAQELDQDEIGELLHLMFELDAGTRIPQPRLRYRFQSDQVGLSRSTHRLYRSDGADSQLRLSLTTGKATAAQNVLAAVYAASALEPQQRKEVFATIRRSLAWRGEIDNRFWDFLTGDLLSSLLHSVVKGKRDQIGWAMDILGLDGNGQLPNKNKIQRGYRDALLLVHPDHGGEVDSAAASIADIVLARQILLKNLSAS